MIKLRTKLAIVVCFLCVVLNINAAIVLAAPITFNTALPVGRGEIVLRQQLLSSQSSSESGIDVRRRETNLVSTIAYGVTPKLTVFGNLALTDRSLNSPLSRQADSGLADTRVLARYTIFRNDNLGTTFRIAPFTGIELATGSNQETDNLGSLPASIQTGSGSNDYFIGTVLTYNKINWGIDAQIQYQQNGSDSGFRFGDTIQVDLSFRKLLAPRSKYFLNGLIEFNFVDTKRNSSNGLKNNDSGGTNLFLSPGIQYVTQKWIIESALQIPILDSQNGNALVPDYSARIGFRRNF